MHFYQAQQRVWILCTYVIMYAYIPIYAILDSDSLSLSASIHAHMCCSCTALFNSIASPQKHGTILKRPHDPHLLAWPANCCRKQSLEVSAYAFNSCTHALLAQCSASCNAGRPPAVRASRRAILLLHAHWPASGFRPGLNPNYQSPACHQGVTM